MTGQLFGVHTAEQLRCGNGKIRLAQYSPAFRYRRKARQNLAAPLGQCRSAENTVGHIAAHTLADPAQLFHGELRRIHPPQAPQHRRRVGAAARHSGAHRDTLFNIQCHTGIGHIYRGKKRLRGAIGQIAPVARQIGRAGAQRNLSVFRLADRHAVAQGNALHHHAQIVISIRPAAQNIQRQI